MSETTPWPAPDIAALREERDQLSTGLDEERFQAAEAINTLERELDDMRTDRDQLAARVTELLTQAELSAARVTELEARLAAMREQANEWTLDGAAESAEADAEPARDTRVVLRERANMFNDHAAALRKLAGTETGQ